MKSEKLDKNKIVIYKPKSGKVEFRVKLEKETIWLTQMQIAKLFGTKRPAITKHLSNIFKRKELFKSSVCSKMEHTASDGKAYKTRFYNLDAIISVGYRVNSREATQFRIWATNVLKKYLLKGYAINNKRLLETRSRFNKLKNIVSFLQKKSQAKLLQGQEKEILDLLSDYSKTLTLLERYDKNKVEKIRGGRSGFVLKYSDCLKIIDKLRENLVAKKEATHFFGNEVDNKFENIIKNLYQTFNKKELYKSIKEKAAYLIYFAIKDHSFIDGNKRIGSFLFVYFLDKNDYLYRQMGEKRISDNALTALALLIAESKPKEKEQMIALITQLLN